MNNKRGRATVLLLRLDPTESICLHDIATYRDQKNSHPPTCRYIMPPWSMLLTNACRHPNRNGFFWRPLQAKRCNNIELGGQGAGKFLGNECDKLWFTVYRSLPGLDFYTRICCRSSLPSYVHEIVPNYTSRTGNCDCLQVLSLQAVATGYDHEEIATLIKKGTVISYYVCIPAQQAKFH